MCGKARTQPFQVDLYVCSRLLLKINWRLKKDHPGHLFLKCNSINATWHRYVITHFGILIHYHNYILSISLVYCANSAKTDKCSVDAFASTSNSNALTGAVHRHKICWIAFFKSRETHGWPIMETLWSKRAIFDLSANLTITSIPLSSVSAFVPASYR